MTSAGDNDRRYGVSDQIGPGTFVAVVGPSGAGKDTLIRAVRAEIGSDPHFHFVRRLVTRSAAPGDEDHDTIDPDEFDLMIGEGRCALAWRAHGLGYALPSRSTRRWRPAASLSPICPAQSLTMRADVIDPASSSR